MLWPKEFETVIVVEPAATDATLKVVALVALTVATFVSLLTALNAPA
jgi:hypothetical protein